MQVLRAEPRGSITEQAPGYVRLEFHSRIFRFVDDVEFALDAQQRVIHVRSASRTGYWDLGVNRERIEAIRNAFREQLTRTPPRKPD